MEIRVASWNIAGGHKIASLGHFDYLEEEIDYFADQLKKVSPDIVCLQEVHTKGKKSNANDLASILGTKVLVNSENSPSHIEKGYSLGNAILSKMLPDRFSEEFLPDPEGDLFWPDGRIAETHKKNIQVLRFEKFNLANNQMLPVSLFGFKYDDPVGRGRTLVEGINDVCAKLVERPIIWCGDFNFGDPLKIYPHMNKLELRDSLPDESTRPTNDGSKKRPDHIFYSPEFRLGRSGVIRTETDHYLCFAEFEF